MNIKVTQKAAEEQSSPEFTWIFYEGFTPAYAADYGRGNANCQGCHADGADYVKSRLP